MILDITYPAQETIENHLEKEYPNEGCGFLFGIERDIREILVAFPVKNNQTGDKKRRFEIAPLDYLKAEEYALNHNLQLLGIYHSHPDHPAFPSEHDRARAVPFFSYLIISVINGKIAETTSWQLSESSGQFEQEHVLNIQQLIIN